MKAVKGKKLRVAAVGDLHYGATQGAVLRDLFGTMSRQKPDLVVLCGDLTDHGLGPEATALAEDLRSLVRVPVVAVLGNHDVDAGKEAEVVAILREAGVTFLDGEPFEIDGLGLAGTKGFCGGFNRCMLEPWGERIVKLFVEEVVNEARKLESALAKLHTEKRLVVLHYSPIHDTVHGEPPEIIPYLGSTRLAEPINAFGADCVLHGHSHFGSLLGKTSAGIPVHNCAFPLRRKQDPAQPFALIEL
jgi:Icc-related predicted phosphoesterase